MYKYDVSRHAFVYETISLGSIFEKKDEQNYTNKAKLYQDILNFCIEQEQGGILQFKQRDIASWLLENNEKIRYAAYSKNPFKVLVEDIYKL